MVSLRSILFERYFFHWFVESKRVTANRESRSRKNARNWRKNGQVLPYVAREAMTIVGAVGMPRIDFVLETVGDLVARNIATQPRAVFKCPIERKPY
jgi:hypothetical protein